MSAAGQRVMTLLRLISTGAGGYAYGNTAGDGVEARDAFANRLGQLEAVVQNQDNREHDLLDWDDYYQFQGGMTNAVISLSGEAPTVYHNDHSDPERTKVRTLKEVIRSRLLNLKWINGMREHGYKGAFGGAQSGGAGGNGGAVVGGGAKRALGGAW